MKYKDLWSRFDSFRNGVGLKVFANIHNLDFNNLQSQYYDKRLPSATDLYNYSKAVGCSMEYLLTGKEDDEDLLLFKHLTSSQDLMDICERLVTATGEELKYVRRALNMEEKNIGSNVTEKFIG